MDDQTSDQQQEKKEVLKDLKGKVRDNKKAIADNKFNIDETGKCCIDQARAISLLIKDVKSLKERLANNDKVLDQAAENITTLAKELKKHKDNHDGIIDPEKPGLPGDLYIDTLEQLKSFVRQYHPYLYSFNSPNGTQTKVVCKAIRDSLIKQCANIELHPSWGNTETGHLDAFYLVTSIDPDGTMHGIIIDFMVASSDGGPIKIKLSWQPHEKD